MKLYAEYSLLSKFVGRSFDKEVKVYSDVTADRRKLKVLGEKPRF